MDDWARPRQYKNGDQIEKGARQWKIGTPKYKNDTSDLFTRGLG